jgi:hypothetical protein
MFILFYSFFRCRSCFVTYKKLKNIGQHGDCLTHDGGGHRGSRPCDGRMKITTVVSAAKRSTTTTESNFNRTFSNQINFTAF